MASPANRMFTDFRWPPITLKPVVGTASNLGHEVTVRSSTVSHTLTVV